MDRVLEGNLPVYLKEVDQSASVEDVRQRSSQAKAESAQSSGKRSSDEKAGFLEERLNLYDNDDFDVFSKDVSVDLSRVHFGKRCVQFEGTLPHDIYTLCYHEYFLTIVKNSCARKILHIHHCKKKFFCST